MPQIVMSVAVVAAVFALMGIVALAWKRAKLGFFRPRTEAPVGVVVMGLGFGGTKEGLLEPYAWRFVQAGFAVLAFDCRCFGGSGGVPRHWMDPSRHREDYEAAVAFIRGPLLIRTPSPRH